MSSREYKTASRKYVGAMIAMPILLVTSYYLFDRLVLGNGQKVIKRVETVGATGAESKD